MVTRQATKEEFISFYTEHVSKFRLNGVQGAGCCPLHNDTEASWSVNVETGQWKCHAGSCDKQGNALTFATLLQIPKEVVPGWEPRFSRAVTRMIDATYDYRLSNGTLVFQCVRMNPKSFFQRRPDPNTPGAWINNLNGVELIPYRLPELLDAIVTENQPQVFIAEGEKDVDNLRSLGFTATCNPQGALKWRDAFCDFLKGTHVVVFPDKDEPGRKHGALVAESLHKRGIAVKVVELPGEGKDVSDWIERVAMAGLSKEALKSELLALSDQAPAWSNSFQVSTLYTEKHETNWKRPNLTTSSLGEFMVSGPSEITWVIDSISPETSATIIGGPPGKGKSWMLLDLAIEISRGGLWIGKFQTKQGQVLYIDEESSEVLLRKRLKKLLAAKGVQPDGLTIEMSIGNGICLTRPDWMERLREKLAAFKPIVVIIDSLVRVHGMKENDATEMAQFFSGVKSLIRDFGCAVIFADHLNKNSNHTQGSDQLLRGSSEKTAFVDSLLLLHSSDEGIVVSHAKSRFAEGTPAFVVRIEDVNESSTVVNYIGEAKKMKQESNQKLAVEFLTGAVNDEWVLRKSLIELAREQDLSTKAIDDALETLEREKVFEKGEAEKSGKGKKPAQYRRIQSPANLFHPLPVYRGETETNSTGESEGVAV